MSVLVSSVYDEPELAPSTSQAYHWPIVDTGGARSGESGYESTMQTIYEVFVKPSDQRTLKSGVYDELSAEDLANWHISPPDADRIWTFIDSGFLNEKFLIHREVDDQQHVCSVATFSALHPKSKFASAYLPAAPPDDSIYDLPSDDVIYATTWSGDDYTSERFDSISTTQNRRKDTDATASSQGSDSDTVLMPDKQARTTRFVWLLGATAVIGAFLFGYNTGVSSSTMIYVPQALDLDYDQQQFVVSISVAFCAVFSLIGGFLNQRYGRKWTIRMGSALFTVGSVICSLSFNYWELMLGRAVVGMAIGFASMTIPPYVAECSPSHTRGTMVLLFQLMITLGILTASVFGALFSLEKFEPAHYGWRLMFGVAVVPAAIQFFCSFTLPESPRWLVSKGRIEETKQVLQLMYSQEDAAWRDYELHEMISRHDSIQMERQIHGGGLTLITMLQTAHVRRALLLGCALQCFQQLSGINTLMYYTATVIRMSGVESAQQSIWYSCLVTFVNLIFTLVPTFLVEKIGRRKLLLTSMTGVLLSTLLLSSGFFAVMKTSALVAKNYSNADIEQFIDNHTGLFSDDDSKTKDAFRRQTQLCAKKQNCDVCVTPEVCGFCYHRAHAHADRYGMCLPALAGTTDRSWLIGDCHNEPVKSLSQRLIDDVVANEFIVSDVDHEMCTDVGMLMAHNRLKTILREVLVTENSLMKCAAFMDNERR